MPTGRSAWPGHDPEAMAYLDSALDEALKGTFPASDPIAIGLEPRDDEESRARSAARRTTSGRPTEEGRETMEQRIAFAKVAPQGIAAFRHLQNYVDQCGIERSLMELVKTRASQINGCAYCLDMHTKDARAAGESEQRLYALSAWRETPFYTERERAALAWTEAVTRIADGPIEDALYEQVRRHFDEKEIVDLTLAVIAINGWNRLAIPFRSPVGSYRPRERAEPDVATA